MRGARGLLGGVLAATLLCLPLGAAAETEPRRGVISLTSENDLFGGTDRNYSNGLRIERVTPAQDPPPLFKRVAAFIPGLDVERTDLRLGLALAHTLYTPEDISAVTPDTQDRPYAAWLRVSGTLVASDSDTQDSLQLNLGMVGPSAGGKFVQTNWHELINGVEPRGWDSQLKDELGLEIVGQRLERFAGPDLPFGLESDLALHLGGALGNVRIYGAGGAFVRVGADLDADFGPPRIRPALSGAGTFEPGQALGGYLFAGLDVRAVARDIFLDGNTFRDSPRVDGRRTWIGDIQAGAAMHYQRVQIAFTYVHRTEQFVAQDGPQRFGAVSISLAY